MGYAVKE